MGQQYRFQISGNISKKLEFLKGSAAQKGMGFSGDYNKGSFWGHGLMCNYFKLGNEMIVNIESVPQGCTFEHMGKLIEDFFK